MFLGLPELQFLCPDDYSEALAIQDPWMLTQSSDKMSSQLGERQTEDLKVKVPGSIPGLSAPHLCLHSCEVLAVECILNCLFHYTDASQQFQLE
jgi:hypothetical protein